MVELFPTLRRVGHHLSRMHGEAGAQSARLDGVASTRHCPHSGPWRCSGGFAAALWNRPLSSGLTLAPMFAQQITEMLKQG